MYLEVKQYLIPAHCFLSIILEKFLYYLGFLSQKFTIHMTTGEGRVYLFNYSLPLPHVLQTLRH